MNINSRNISIIYLFLYISLLLGFYFNEDFALGYKSDNLIYRNLLFEKDFLHSFLNIKFDGLPSPIYLILLSFLEKISFNEIFTRLIALHFSL